MKKKIRLSCKGSNSSLVGLVRVSRSYLILFYPIFLAKCYFVLFFGKCPILSYFLAILPLILVFYSLFITIISRENIP